MTPAPAVATTAAPAPTAAGPLLRRAVPRSLPLAAFVDRLREACEPRLDAERIQDLLGAWRPSLESLRPLVAFDPVRYARRRVFRGEVFELILMCWDSGQATPVHDHDGQSGWITVLEGSLTVQEYARRGGPANLSEIRGEGPTPAGFVPLVPAARLTVPAGSSVAEAAAPESIHRVGPKQGRALSLHLYSGPLDSFLVFDPVLGSARRVRP